MTKKQIILFLSGTGLISLALLLLLIYLPNLEDKVKTHQVDQTCFEKLKNWQNVDASKICQDFGNAFPFKGDVTEISASEVNSPAMQFDKDTEIRLYHSAKEITTDAYCYFTFKKYLGDGSIDPKTFGEVISGFSILAQDLPTYQSWIKSNLGSSCVQRVQADVGTTPSDLSSLKGKSLVALFPLGAFQPGMSLDDLKKEITVTLNHERIHLLENYCMGFEDLQNDFYQNADPQEVLAYSQKFPSYDWNDSTIAAKEYMAFKFEDRPLDLQKNLNCSGQ